MKVGIYSYTPKIFLTFTEAEIDAMIEVSRRHYDWECKKLADRGFLNGLKNSVINGEAEWEFNSSDIDLLMKVLEMLPYHDYKQKGALEGMSRKLFRVFDGLNQEWRRLNPELAIPIPDGKL